MAARDVPDETFHVVVFWVNYYRYGCTFKSISVGIIVEHSDWKYLPCVGQREDVYGGNVLITPCV